MVLVFSVQRCRAYFSNFGIPFLLRLNRTEFGVASYSGVFHPFGGIFHEVGVPLRLVALKGRSAAQTRFMDDSEVEVRILQGYIGLCRVLYDLGVM